MPFLAAIPAILGSILPEMAAVIPEIGADLTGAIGALGSGDVLGALGLSEGALGTGALGTGLSTTGAGLLGVPTAIGGMLDTPLLAAGTAMGLPAEIAAPLSTFLSPEILGAGIGYGAGGVPGMEMGLGAGMGLGGGGTGLSQLIGNVGTDLGLPAGAAQAAGNVAPSLAQGGMQLGEALTAPQPTAFTPPPSNTITPTQAPSTGMAPSGGGPSGLSLAGNTAPQVGPWVSSFWGNSPMVGNAAPATSTTPSANRQQQFLPSP